MGKILITGISGNVGRYVYEALVNLKLDLKEELVGALTSTEKYKGMYRSAQLVNFDFLDKTTYSDALEGIDRVFLIRPPHLGKPEDLYPFIDAMKQKKIKLVVFLSLMGVEKNTIPPHHKIEKYIEKTNLAFCHIRPGFFMQNLAGVHAKEIREKNHIFIPAGKSRCSFIDTKDIGYATAKVLSDFTRHQNVAYTLTGREALDYYQIANILSEVLNKKITYSKPSWFRFRQYMIHKRKFDKKMVNVMVMLYFMTRLGTGSPIHDDFTKITGHKPRSFEEFAKENKQVWM